MIGHRNLHSIWLAPLAGLILFTTPALAQTGSLARSPPIRAPTASSGWSKAPRRKAR